MPSLISFSVPSKVRAEAPSPRGLGHRVYTGLDRPNPLDLIPVIPKS